MRRGEQVLVIGGGVIGVCSAYYLAQAGCSVVLIEKGDICSGCSYGNAGLLCPSHSVPLAAPGVVLKALQWMADDCSPFYIRPRLDLELFSWLLKFATSSREAQSRRNMPVLRGLMEASLRLYRELAAIPGIDFGLRQEGTLTLFKTQPIFEEGRREAALLLEIGVKSKILTAAETCDMEPTVLPHIAGSIYFPGDSHLIPADFVRCLAREAQALGVSICTSTEVIELEAAGSRISNVKTTRGDFQPDHVVLAGGFSSPLLTRSLQIRLPIQAAKGYSVTIKPRNEPPKLPLGFKEARVVATPMGEILRFGGTLELAGADSSINLRRVDAVREAAKDYTSGLRDGELIEIWRGLRPCTPDGLPIVGRHDRFQNLVFATGHAMLGMSMGPATGKLVAQIISGEPPLSDLTPLRLSRFN
ncbi:MAG TPA: FAD-dependent oxidoreductase [Bryobacteraceae bacterium]|nr:FAD-dependent oxidoreductase [Bryobacteraceae bacterium]